MNIHSKIFTRNILFALLFLTNLLFLAYFVILAYYSRPHFDDLHFMWATRDYGLFGFVDYIYQIGSGRFIMFFIVGLLAKLQYIFDGNLLIQFFI
jgi:hypothetical protein